MEVEAVETAAQPEEPPDPVYERTLAALRNPAGARGSAWMGFAVSLGLFVVFSGAWSDPTGLAVLVAVLLFHELGHFVAMKAFGYRDVRMFFIPFFGAAVSGRPVSVQSWKQAVALLAGPGPGILVAVAALRFGWTGAPLGTTLVGMLLFINLLNLLPIVPFDGGKLFELVAFGRSPTVEIVATIASALAVAALGMATGSAVLYVVAAFVAISIPRRYRSIVAAAAFRAEVPQPTPRIEDAPEPELRALYRTCLRPEVASQARGPEWLAIAMRSVHDRALAARPGLGASIGLLGAYVAVAALGIVPLVPAFKLMGASNAFDREIAVQALTVRYPSSFTLAQVPSGITLDRGAEAVLVWSEVPADKRSPESYVGALGMSMILGAPLAAGAKVEHGRGPCAGLDGPRASWRGTVNGGVVNVVLCGVSHGERLYAVAYVEAESLAPERRAASRIAAEAHF